MLSPAEVLSEGGVLARHIAGFAPRAQQLSMAEAVAEALSARHTLVVEAGTGTGKTFAYLVPALLSGQKVIVSTGTRNLQDQLFGKDLPVVRDALDLPVDISLLKGRANYLCHHRLQMTLAEGRLQSRAQVHQLHRIERWAATTADGDIGGMGELAEDSPLWPAVTSTADNCLGGECDYLDECFLNRARRRAQEADVVVVNHHLLLADMALREEGFGELLPGADAVIVDEAHQLPDVASNFFGVAVTANQLIGLARDSVAEDIKEAGESRDLAQRADALEKAARDLRLALGEAQRRGPWNELESLTEVPAAIDTVTAALEAVDEALTPLAERGRGLENCLERCQGLRERFAQVSGPTPEGHIHWYETHTRSFSFNLTPLDVAALFAERLQERPCAWVFTSATLAVNGDFHHFSDQLGLEAPHTLCEASPFDYARQALLFVPPQMPDPRDAGYTDAVVEAALPVLEASGGRAFLLFTSHRALRRAAELLAGRTEFPLLVQGEAPRARLLERFRELGNAVLLGTGSFWEGVDVRGEALSCVVIDKLPFASPADPILKARIEALRRNGGNPFVDYQIPQAAITLKQGVGRLIRDVDDYGLLMLCDPRLTGKGYGRIFLEALPPMVRTRSLEKACWFFEKWVPVQRAVGADVAGTGA